MILVTGCDGPPARLVVGSADTVIVNNVRAVRMPAHVFDARNRVLPDTGVRYQLISGTELNLSNTGIGTCTQSGDATVRASIGTLATDFLVRCRPVREVRALRMVNLVVGAPAQDLPFAAIGIDGQPVTLLAGHVTVEDSTVASVEGTRIRALRDGSTALRMRVGNRSAYAAVHSYRLVASPEGIRPGQHVATRISLTDGQMRQWRLAAAPQMYFIAMLPDSDDQPMPKMAIVGAACSDGLGPHEYFCLVQKEGSLIVFYPQGSGLPKVLSGTLAVWRQSPEAGTEAPRSKP
jgi:hypothetical protein